MSSSAGCGGDSFGVGFRWVVEQPAGFDSGLAAVHRAMRAGLAGVVESGVDWILREAGLLAVLDRVSGDAGELHEAAVVWMEQALAVRGISARVRGDGAGVAGSWRGAAAREFGEAMGTWVAAVDRLACETAATAHLLNEAGVTAGAARDLVTGIVTDAAEWAAAELAATAVADVLTLGLATIGGALAESATLAAFVVRAERVAAEFGVALERLATELAELKAIRDGIAAAHGLRRLRAVRQAQGGLAEMRGAGAVLRAAERGADAIIGMETGLPIDGDGPKGLGSAIAKTAAEEVHEVESGR
ncbi:hypothetical protein GCM10009839_85410 [Catenulispora yoronensis]|uniref:WXG100 family type VII secretion target n=1 Tax=Catenulispora yoronensis TaxID=450799 RepID=A0ABN2VGA5_9ACTN